MLSRLRRKFIFINMVMVTVVVVAVLCAIGVVSWQQNIASVYAAMDSALSSAQQQHNGRLSIDLPNSLLENTPFGATGSDFFAQNQNSTDGETDSSSSSDEAPAVPQLGNSDSTIPIAVYQLNSSNIAVLVSRVTTASLDNDVLNQAVTSVLASSSDRGLLEGVGLFYETQQVNGSTYVAFADKASASAWQSLVLVLVGIGVLTLLVFFGLSVVFSRWALRPVEEAWEQQRQFVADASHELKTPLTVILANMSIALKHSDDTVSSQSQWLESTQHEAQSMQDLVTDLLDLARLESNDTPVSFEQLDVSDLTEGCLLQFESVAFERNVLMQDDITSGISLQGNRANLQRLIIILLDNACKYALPGTAVSVSLTNENADFMRTLPHSCLKGTLPKGSCALLKVGNAGTPIDAEDLPHLFDRFYRSDKARTRTQGSYGLGLAIACGIAQAHHGAILAQSTPEGETTFMVALPLQ